MKPLSKKEAEKYPAQDKAVPFGMAPAGTSAYEPYKKGSEDARAMYWDHVKESLFDHGALWSTVVKELKAKFKDITPEDLEDLKQHAKKYMQHVASGGGAFPSVSWMPRGQEDKDVSSNASLHKEADSYVKMPMSFRIDDESLLSYANQSTYRDKIMSGQMSNEDWQGLIRDTARWMMQANRATISETFSMDPGVKWNIDEEQLGKLKSMFSALPKGSSLKREARFDTPYWIDPAGQEYEFKDATHDVWAERNAQMLKQKYGVDFAKMNPKRDSYMSYLIDNGWTRAGVSDHGMLLHTRDLNNLSKLDNFVAKMWRPEFDMVQIETYDVPLLTIDDPFPSLQKAVRRLRGSLDLLTQDEQDQIAAKFGPEMNIALSSFAEAVKNGHSRERAFKYALQGPAKVSEKDLLQAIKVYLKGRV